jgi:hypothetical protein
MKKLEQLKKLLNSPHISEDMKNKTKEAIEKLEKEEGKKSSSKKEKSLPNLEDIKLPGEGEDSDWRYDLADMISGGEDPEATKIWKGLSDKKKDEFIKYMHELDTDFSNAGNWENGKRPTLKDSKENVLYLFGDNAIQKAKAKKATRKGKGVKALLKDKPKDTGVPNCDELLDSLRKRKKSAKKYQKKVKANGGEPLGNDKECDCKELLDACVQIREVFRINHASEKEGGKRFFSKGFKIEFDILDKAIKNHK